MWLKLGTIEGMKELVEFFNIFPVDKHNVF